MFQCDVKLHFFIHILQCISWNQDPPQKKTQKKKKQKKQTDKQTNKQTNKKQKKQEVLTEDK